MSDFLQHIGTPHVGATPHSGRYAWGTGEHGHQRDTSFLYRVEQYKKAGITDEKELVKALNLKSTTEYRDLLSNAKAAKRAADVAYARRLADQGLGATEIGRRMGGISESTIRSYLNPVIEERARRKQNVAELLEKSVNEKKYIDVGAGVENRLGVSQTMLRAAVKSLESKGYHTETIYVEQLGTGKQTTLKVLCGPDTTWSDLAKNKDKIALIDGYSEDGARSILNLEPPVSVSSDRIQINYESPKDGVIELRRGVDDISLGNASYAQVRIAVDDSHYLKGMAMYSDKMPPGVDIIFNTNKKKGTPMMDPDPNASQVLKPLKKDKDNPFGATIKPEEKLNLAQRHYIDKNGERKLSAINVVNEEGEWASWSRTLSSQFLSKQSTVMAKRQLNLTYANQADEFNTIKSLTNPVIKQKLLEQFADDCDSKAVHLQAAALPRQATHIILPFPNMKEGEVYAPNYRNGEKIALVRYPHGGKFEIAELKVNNNNKEAKKLLGNAPDAIGIHPSVAGRLSGADFDGDFVITIPTNRKVKVDIKDPNKSSALRELQNFDPKERYPGYEGMRVMNSKNPKEKGIEMGKVSNLITDMTLHGASDEEIARAVKHSMVVIDAEKHKLNWKQSEIDNGIRELYKKYQGKPGGGASTLISSASSKTRVDDRKEKRPSQMTPEELERYKKGEKIWQYTGKEYYDRRTGKMTKKQFDSTKMYETKDAYSLTSGGSKRNPGTTMEAIYADHANKLKALGNAARKEARAIEMPPTSQSAKKAYAPEVASLNAKLNIAMKNKPLERQAQLIANKELSAKRAANPDMTADEVKRVKSQLLDGARHRVGKTPYTINITDREWEAIQSGAVASTKLKQIIDGADIDKVKQRAMPRQQRGLTPTQQSRIRALAAAGFTQREIADKMGVSTSTVSQYS